MGGLQSTYYAESTTNRADFDRSGFQTLIQQKGRDVILEQALQCPCKSKDSNQQSNCKNCGGTGWAFINPRSTRMILQGLNMTPDYKAWSEEIKGDMKVTCSDTDELTFMDRITVLAGRAIFNEVLFFKTKITGDVTTTFAYTGYAIKQIKYIGYFTGVGSTYNRLVEGIDYTFQNNIIILINAAIIPIQGNISITIRYVHAPVYYINEMKRESMESFEYRDGEKLIHLPLFAIARRAHYLLTAPNLSGDRLLSNSYVVNTITQPCECSQQIIVPPIMPSTGPIIFPFTNQTSISITHNFKRLVMVAVYDSNNSIMTEGVGYTVQADPANVLNTIIITFPQGQSGTVLIQ